MHFQHGHLAEAVRMPDVRACLAQHGNNVHARHSTEGSLANPPGLRAGRRWWQPGRMLAQGSINAVSLGKRIVVLDGLEEFPASVTIGEHTWLRAEASSASDATRSVLHPRSMRSETLSPHPAEGVRALGEHITQRLGIGCGSVRGTGLRGRPGGLVEALLLAAAGSTARIVHSGPAGRNEQTRGTTQGERSIS